ncbi:MAG TPA: hypothetical protein VF598_08385, partial [Hymenobacter sp.]
MVGAFKVISPPNPAIQLNTIRRNNGANLGWVPKLASLLNYVPNRYFFLRGGWRGFEAQSQE